MCKLNFFFFNLEVGFLEMEISFFFFKFQIGDCVLEVNGEDILGLKITEVAQKVRSKSNAVCLLVWNASVLEVRNESFNILVYFYFQYHNLPGYYFNFCRQMMLNQLFSIFKGFLHISNRSSNY